MDEFWAPVLARGVRVVVDPVREGQPAVLFPEGVLLLNETASAVVSLCDGRRDLAAIVSELTRQYDGVTLQPVATLVDDLVRRRIVTSQRTRGPVLADGPWPIAAGPGGGGEEPIPVGLLAELTYRCPLRCTYCSNPVNLADYADELTTSQWRDCLDQARALGVLQLHLSGGEPLLRSDLVDIVAHARGLGLYTNLITSGLTLNGGRLDALAGAGLDHVQLSLQDVDPGKADAVAGIRAHAPKLEAARLLGASGLPLTVNVVLHAGNVDRLVSRV